MNKKKIEKAYNQMLLNVEKISMDIDRSRINCYVCPAGHITKTVEIDKGVTPFMILCPYCDKMAQSTFYKEVAPDHIPRYEWYRPSLEETLKESASSRQYILDGGLYHRDTEEWKRLQSVTQG
jgi:hypothetical protein